MRLNDGRVVPNFIYQALTGQPITVYGQGDQTRAFQYYSDLVEGIYRLLLSNESLPVNIGNPHTEITVLELAERIIELSRSQSKIIFVQPTDDRFIDDPRRRRPDITRARQILQWEPSVPVNDGLAETIAYFRQRMPQDPPEQE
jgi:dTDP-glucose 4,6-dehydratase